MDPSAWISRRPPQVCRHGMVAATQPLATQIGIDVLKQGGNAADAAVAVAAAMTVTEPDGTGLGGDAFCLFYDAKTKTVKGLNGSGRAPANLTIEKVRQDGFGPNDKFPISHGHTITVPGAAAAWVDTVEKFGSGKFSMRELLNPAIQLAEEGFPVHGTVALSWKKNLSQLQNNPHGKDLLINDRAPKAGEIMRMPLLAKTFKTLAEEGKKGFYTGRIAQAIVDAAQAAGGVMSLEDLASHVTTYDDPIYVDYKGVRVWEIPPSGQGITALMALNILEGFQLKDLEHNSAEYLHLLIEALGLAFADSAWYCADPAVVQVPIEGMLSKYYAAERRKKMSRTGCLESYDKGSPFTSSDTVYFTAVDKDGNACSFINSVFMAFGSGIVPEGCGFSLQNRGWGFSLDAEHPNCVAPRKRPYHTIIPAMITHPDSGELLGSYGVMGGFMQPQGHVQVLLNMLEFGMDPQQALDMPRFCIGPGHQGSNGDVNMEDGITSETIQKLATLGHKIIGPIKGIEKRSVFGRGQVITKGAWWSKDDRIANDPDVWWGGGDPRGDSLVVGY